MLIPNCMIKIKESYTLFLFFMNSSFPYIFVKRSAKRVSTMTRLRSLYHFEEIVYKYFMKMSINQLYDFTILHNFNKYYQRVFPAPSSFVQLVVNLCHCSLFLQSLQGNIYFPVGVGVLIVAHACRI